MRMTIVLLGVAWLCLSVPAVWSQTSKEPQSSVSTNEIGRFQLFQQQYAANDEGKRYLFKIDTVTGHTEILSNVVDGSLMSASS